MNQTEDIWKAKLVARVHDPAEKALVLFRDRAGHEAGSARMLRDTLFPEGISEALNHHVRRADQWASAADRPQFPRDPEGNPYAEWAQVRFYEDPVLIHPLSGEEIKIREGFADVDPEHLKAISIDHFKSLVVKDKAGGIDFRRTALAFWRFGIERPAPRLGVLWELLPADTRVPDHTIWTHLDLTAAFATAFSADPNAIPALLLVTFGPVQDFIAQSRTTSDLWAGSHLLSRIAWEGIKVICERLGPESVLFPALRGIPQVDLWLEREEGLSSEWFEDTPWRNMRSDANPLFGAALPNRFVALVPRSLAENLAQEVTTRLRTWAKETGKRAVELLIAAARIPMGDATHCLAQLEKQLKDFPEVFWAAVPWSLVSEKDDGIDVSALEDALRSFYPEEYSESGKRPGFLGSPAWGILSRAIGQGESNFYRPNRGVLYPAFYDLTDRMLAAAKSFRPFPQMQQEGYRCSLCGEREWLTPDPADLSLAPGQRQNTLWARVAKTREAWARKGEHLCGLCTIKRLWPNLFVKEVGPLVDGLSRYVVSTHTMALSTSVEAWLDSTREKKPPTWLRMQVEGQRAALPQRLDRRLRSMDDGEMDAFFRGLPVFLDDLRDALRSSDAGERKQAEEILDKTENALKDLFGHKPEAYYGLILMDGDKMGAWISGSDESLCLQHKSVWHPKIRTALGEDRKEGVLSDYVNSMRSASPARHMAISGALNSFSLELSRYVVEDLYKGKLLYAGGDDLLAMVSVDDLLSAMLTLRLIYSGVSPKDFDDEGVRRFLCLPGISTLKIRRGYVLTQSGKRSRLYRTMGGRATASIGGVVAHHMAPLGSVLRTLRLTERRAKNQGRRNAFALTLLKRAGGAVELTCPWYMDGLGEMVNRTPMGILLRLRNALADGELSGRAPHLILQWLRSLPHPEDFERLGLTPGLSVSILHKNLSYQFQRQGAKETREANATLAEEIVSLALNAAGHMDGVPVAAFLEGFLTTAEFLAREGRSGQSRF